MLFVALLEVTGGTPEERTARRAEWQYPEGIRPIAEYWLQDDDYAVVSIFEADDNAAIFAVYAQWGDVFNIKVMPAVTAEQELKLAQQMMAG